MAPEEHYVQSIIAIQTRLYAYLLTLLGDTEAADDVLQETNVVLCRKAEEFSSGTNFEAWAFQIARFQCMAHWRIRRRERLVFDSDALDQLASSIEQQLASTDLRTAALRRCLNELPRQQRSLIEERYSGCHNPVRQMSERLGRSEGAISQSLHRVRLRLLKCMQSRMAQT